MKLRNYYFILTLNLCLVNGFLFSQDGDWRATMAVSDIKDAQKLVDEYTPQSRIYLVNYASTPFLLRAVSKVERKKYFESMPNASADQIKTLNEGFDELSKSAEKKIPLYLPDEKNFAFKLTADEETKIKSKLKNVSTLKIYKIGSFHSVWQIEKREKYPYEIIRRYKKIYVWAKDSSDDYAYCHLYFLNLLQDFDGAGYGSTYAVYNEDTIFGCPK